MSKHIALCIALFASHAATAQRIGPAAFYTQINSGNLYSVGVESVDAGRHATWQTAWSASIRRGRLSGFMSEVGPRYKISGFQFGVSCVLYMPILEDTEGVHQQTRLFVAPAIGVQNGAAKIELAYLAQVFPDSRTHALQVRVSYLLLRK